MTIVLMSLALLFGAEFTVKVAEPVMLHGMEVNFEPINPDEVVFRTDLAMPVLGR